jgi:hypothetical protein
MGRETTEKEDEKGKLERKGKVMGRKKWGGRQQKRKMGKGNWRGRGK